MPASTRPHGRSGRPADSARRAVRLVGPAGGFAPVASPALTLRRRIGSADDPPATPGDTDARKWPPLVRIALPIVLSLLLWGGILALILRR